MDLLKHIPERGGIYLLFIRVKKSIDVETRGKFFYIREGIYVYVGSARGPGGLRARLKRHMRISKKLFWHIDYLLSSNYAELIRICFHVVEEDIESIVASELTKTCSPIIGFGSSDKRRDLSHLFYCGQDFKSIVTSISENLSQFKCLNLDESYSI